MLQGGCNTDGSLMRAIYFRAEVFEAVTRATGFIADLSLWPVLLRIPVVCTDRYNDRYDDR
jgi:hypothetical protein